MAFLKGEEKQSLLDRYFDIEWGDDVSDLRCVRCHRVAIQPYVSSCQHIFCKMCRKFYRDEEQRLSCPQCQDHITLQDTQDFDMEIKIHQLKIFCPNKKFGCKFSDQLREMPSHLKTCAHTRKAVLQVEAQATTTLTDVVNQLTKLNETMRKVKNKVDDLEKKSDDIDGKLNVLINGDKKNEATNGNMQLALQSMRLKLESVNQKIEQSELLQQQTMALKIDQMKAKMDLMAQQNNILQNKKSEELNSLKDETYEWIIKDVQRNLVNSSSEYESEVFKFPGCKYDIKAKIYNAHDTTVWTELQFINGDKSKRLPYKEAFTAVTYIVRDQSDNAMKQDSPYKIYLRFGDNRGMCKWILSAIHYDTILSPPYLKDDSIKITILLERPTMDRDFISNNGVLLWRVDNYEKRKEEHSRDDIWSPPFYTSPHGYRVGIKLDLWRSVSLQIYFLTGEHDDTLPSWFAHKITATLINQIDTSKNLVESTDNEYQSRYQQYQSVGDDIYDICFHPTDPIESDGFVKDDSLLLEVAIEPRIEPYISESE